MGRPIEHVLYVSFRLDVKTLIADTEKVEKVVGKTMGGAGSGLGVRDVEFYYGTNKRGRDAAAERARQAGYEVNTAEY